MENYLEDNKKEGKVNVSDGQTILEKNFDIIEDIKKAQNGDKDAMAKLV